MTSFHYPKIKNLKCLTCQDQLVLCDCMGDDCGKSFGDYYCIPDCEYLEMGPIQLCKFLGHAGFYEPDRVIKPNIPLSIYKEMYKQPFEMQKYYNQDGSDDYKYTIEECEETTRLDEFTINQLLQYPDETINSKYFIPYYVGLDDKMYFSIDNCLAPTGPDGGYYHFWKCLKCQEIFDASDK